MIGEIYDEVCGFHSGGRYLEVLSEPFNLRDSEYVQVKDSDGNYFDIEVDELLYSRCFKLRKDNK